MFFLIRNSPPTFPSKIPSTHLYVTQLKYGCQKNVKNYAIDFSIYYHNKLQEQFQKRPSLPNTEHTNIQVIFSTENDELMPEPV